MMKNMKFKYEHEKFGVLNININGETQQQKCAINSEFAKKYENADMQTFLHALYISHLNNDNLIDIIGEFLVVDNGNLTKVQIIEEINKKYNELYTTTDNSSEDTFTPGNGICLEITPENEPDNKIFTANIVIEQDNNSLSAHIEENMTVPEYRHNGLQRIGFMFLERYLSYNEIGKITLEARDLDGNEFDLNKAYENLGFYKTDSGIYEKDIDTFNNEMN